MIKFIVNFLIISIVAFGLLPVSAGEILSADTVWRGEVTLDDDLLIPEGVTLTIMPSTVINVQPSDRTRTDPEYLSSMTEITVRGRLDAEGEADSRVVFRVDGTDAQSQWSGIIIDGGAAFLGSSLIMNAETGLQIISGSATVMRSQVINNRYGVVAYGDAVLKISDTEISGNRYGIFELSGSRTGYSNVSVRDNEKKDIYLYGEDKKNGLHKVLKGVSSKSIYAAGDKACQGDSKLLMMDYPVPEKSLSMKYGDEVLLEDTIWSGRIEIGGIIRVPQDTRLIIMPGTLVEFRRKDTNGDGIGENGLLMQGVLIAKGTRENPIIFRSAELNRRAGDWDAINILNSDGARSLIEFAQIQDAYRGLHFHFSNVMVNSSVLKNNYTAIQFQESSVELRGNYIYNNKNGVKARDSEISFYKNYILNNINGVNFFRASLTAYENSISGNMLDGLKIREGTNNIYDNLVSCNRFGIMVSDTYFGKFNRNVISNNLETGISLRDSDNIEINGNYLQGNGFSGVSLLSVGAVIKGNNISDNGERGIGIQAFSGLITENSISGNRMYAIENESSSDIEAPMNWWGDGSVDKAVFDRSDDEMVGEVMYSPVRNTPILYEWPINIINSKIKWRDRILLSESVTVSESGELKIVPGTEIAIAKGKGIKVSGGKIIARGNKKNIIYFNSISDAAEERWGEILLEHADGSIFSHCNIQGAEWALHSHFTSLPINNCNIRNNYGGIRFRSGPLEISNSVIADNTIGMRIFRGTASIIGNDIIKNETGIFVREKGGGLTIRKNNISSNSRYNIRVGDFDLEDVDARENWWGTASPEDTIFDGRREPGVGKVLFEPVLTEPVAHSK